jgi:hypothetical protein
MKVELTMPETQTEAFVRTLRESSEQTIAYLKSVHAGERDPLMQPVVARPIPSPKARPFR